MMNVNIILNEEKNGIELRFDGKPEAEVIEALKSNGFRWSGKQKMWFAKQTDERMAFVNEMFKSAMDSNPCGGSSVSFKNKTEKQAYDLWEMTRTEDIPNNFELHKIYDTKEIAAIVRKHIKPRFPMCKFSVRSDYNSIDVDLLASPFAKGSDELKAIVHYIYVFVESYNYNNSDSMTDYFDVNFYFSSEGNIVSYRYEQTEMNESGIAFNVDIVRAIPDDAMDFKIAMYRLLEEPEHIRDQFDRANLEEGQKITIVRFDDILGGVRAGQVTFKRYEYTDWGGKEGVKLIVTVPHKRGEYYQILNSECLVIDGWVEIPRELFWEEVPSTNGFKCEKTRFLSFDRKQYDVTLDYFRSIGIKPIINTYKPQFN